MEAHKRNTTQQQIKCSATFGKWNCVFELVRVIALQNFENGTVYSNLSMSLKRTQAFPETIMARELAVSPFLAIVDPAV